MSEQAPLVVIVYRDPFFELDDGDTSEPVVMSVVGYEVFRYEGYTSIASESGSDGSLRAVTHIPNDIVVSRTPVREPLIPPSAGTH